MNDKSKRKSQRDFGPVEISMPRTAAKPIIRDYLKIDKGDDPPVIDLYSFE